MHILLLHFIAKVKDLIAHLIVKDGHLIGRVEDETDKPIQQGYLYMYVPTYLCVYTA